MNLRHLIEAARKPTPWHFSNEVLYQLCSGHPGHTEAGVVLAKVLLIGRAYAAAIERRKVDRDTSGDDFYIRHVAPAIIRSPIDRWLNQAQSKQPGTREALDVMVRVHGHTTELFRDISGLEKRSLASKYLHFHVPGLFFIYDSRAVQGLRKVRDFVGAVSNQWEHGDQEYALFAEKCTRLSKEVTSVFGYKLKPRELDNLLLALSAR
ncbi:MAG: hypothetical protein EXQ50_14230 [Acidobacteria bacterium]|nr:hypothetical protein [Acidobacteriota bacterium]